MNCSALIVTYNRLEKLKLTIANTVKLNFTAIVVVNNGSTDGTQAWLATLSDPRVIVLNLPSNSGGAGGFKAGSQYLCDNVDSDWVFFYDDDAWPRAMRWKNLPSWIRLTVGCSPLWSRIFRGNPVR